MKRGNADLIEEFCDLGMIAIGSYLIYKGILVWGVLLIIAGCIVWYFWD